MPYRCKQCTVLGLIDAPICPGCNQFLVDDLDAVEGFMKPMPPAEKTPIDWCTAFGHWGDCFVSAGRIKRLLEMAGQSQCKVLYVGPDMRIVEWLRAQEFVSEARGVQMTIVDDYPRFWQKSCARICQVADWLSIIKQFGEDLPHWWQFTQTHINNSWFFSERAVLWHGARLPEKARQWAACAYEQSRANQHPDGKIIHFHPVSVWSEIAQNHWPLWKPAIERLLITTPHTYVLTGQQSMENLCSSDRLINLLGKSPGNMEVLALSEMCDAVISTPNNIALWSVVQQQKALCMGNEATKHVSSYYTRFLRRGERMTYMGVETSLDEFIDAVYPWLEEVKKCPTPLECQPQPK